MGLWFDMVLGVAAIISIMFFLMKFQILESIHLVVGSVAIIFVFLLIFGTYVFAKSGRGEENSGETDLKKKAQSGRMRHRDVVNRINEILVEEQVINNPEYLKWEKEEFVHKKTHDIIQFWGIIGRLKHSLVEVLIIYSVSDDDIVKYRPRPSAAEREDPFYNWDPIRVERLMRRDQDRKGDEDEDEEPMEISFRASSGKKRKRKRNRRNEEDDEMEDEYW